MNSTIGLVVALPAEARALIGHGPWQRLEGRVFRCSCLENGTGLIIVRSGLGVENSLSAAQWLIKKGVAALGALGVSGGLDPGLEPGDLILADSVVQEGEGECNQIWAERSRFVEIALAGLTAREIPAYRGAIVTVQRPVLSTHNKKSLFAKTMALAVDMESAAVAHVANEASLPFFALRTVCDVAARTVPREIFDCLNQAGHIRLLHLFRMLLLKPTLVSDLLRTRKDFTMALASLGRAWNIQIKNSLPSLLPPGIGSTIRKGAGV